MEFSLYRTIHLIATHTISTMSVAAMRALSSAIEDTVLTTTSGATLSAGFQRTSYFRLQEARYRTLAQVCSAIVVHALPDMPAPAIDGIRYVPLGAENPLAREWFLIVNTPGFAAALVAQERDGPPSAPRHFQALFTTDGDVVDQAEMILLGRVDAPYEPPAIRDDTRRQQNLQRIMGHLIAQQDAPARVSRRTAQADEARELTRLIPAFAGHEDWQHMLLRAVERRMDDLNA